MDLKILYTDLDGTLVGPGGSLFATPGGGVTTRASDAIAKLHERGVQLALVSGRTQDMTREVARVVGAQAYVAELGALIVDRGDPPGAEDVVRNFGAHEGTATPYEAMARSGAGAFLLERYGDRLEPHTPWSAQRREATMLFRGELELDEAQGALDEAGYTWLTLHDNGIISRTSPGLNAEEVHAYHLVPRGVSKAGAVRIHLEREGLAPQQAAAVGDSRSDLELAGEVGALFIVANGRASVGDAAEDIENVRFTESTHGDGFAEAVELLLG